MLLPRWWVCGWTIEWLLASADRRQTTVRSLPARPIFQSVSQSACAAHVNCGRGAVRTGTHVIRRLLLGKHARRMTAFSDARLSENTRVPDMELDYWVTWVIFHVRVTGSSFWPGMRPEFFQFFEKLPKMQNVHLKCWNDKSHCQVSVVGLKSLDVSPCNELLLLPMIIKNYLAW